jgi:KRAB domain-containing zinc finger protein
MTKHECVVCHKLLSCPWSLKRHSRQHLNKTTDPVKLTHCYFCSKNTKYPSRLIKHMVIHTNEELCKCERCCRSFMFRDTFLRHVRRKSCGESTGNLWVTKCYFCHRNFPQPSLLHTHLKIVHLREGFKRCHICGQYFPGKSTLTNHIRSVHRSERKLKCELCNRLHSNRSALNQHITATHTTERPINCYFCKKPFSAFGSDAQLPVHMRRHTREKPFLCYFCKDDFAHQVARDVHLRRKHINERPFRCSSCPARYFTMKGDLDQHIRNVHTNGSGKHK